MIIYDESRNHEMYINPNPNGFCGRALSVVQADKRIVLWNMCSIAASVIETFRQECCTTRVCLSVV